jgi:glucosamine--fructose-6-phosphate aminotransferase (isomerizing)
MAVVGKDYPVLLFGQPDESLESVASLAGEFASRGARVVSAGVPGAPGTVLPVLPADPLVAPILQIASFYRLANALAVARGLDPDRPRHLTKITETLCWRPRSSTAAWSCMTRSGATCASLLTMTGSPD